MARSAGILLYRLADGEPEVLLVHPGGPFWARKDAGAWSIPKGEHGDDEDPRGARCASSRRRPARRCRRRRSTSSAPCAAERQARDRVGGRGRPRRRRDPSNTFDDGVAAALGPQEEFPEVDRAGWFGLDAAREKLNPAQVAFLDRLGELLA